MSPSGDPSGLDYRARRRVGRQLAARRDAILQDLSPENFELQRGYGAINALAGSVNAAAVLELLESPHVVSVAGTRLPSLTGLGFATLLSLLLGAGVWAVRRGAKIRDRSRDLVRSARS